MYLCYTIIQWMCNGGVKQWVRALRDAASDVVQNVYVYIFIYVYLKPPHTYFALLAAKI